MKYVVTLLVSQYVVIAPFEATLHLALGWRTCSTQIEEDLREVGKEIRLCSNRLGLKCLR